MCRHSRLACTVLLVLATTTLTSVRADTFVMNDDRKVVGTVVKTTRETIDVHTRDGIVTISRSDVSERIRKKTDFDRYLKRLKRTKRTSAKAQCSLADWCVKRGLVPEAIKHYESTLHLAPDHKAARAALAELRSATPPIDEKKKATAEKRRAGTVFLKLSEETAADSEAAGYLRQELGRFFSSLDQPLRFASSERSAEFTLELSLDATFERTQKFYGKIEIGSYYFGSAGFTLRPVGKKPVIRIAKLKHEAKLPPSLEREHALQITRQETLDRVLARLSVDPFFERRGATPRPLPEE